MSKTAIFYASEKGTTEGYAEKIADLLDCDLYNMADTEVTELEKYDNLILMSSHYYWGYLQNNWGGKVKFLSTVDLKGKKVALVGVGSQVKHPDSFCSGLNDFQLKLGDTVKFVGQWPSSDYKFTFSRAEKDGKMAGLCLDATDPEEKNEERINKWVEIIKKEFA